MEPSWQALKNRFPSIQENFSFSELTTLNLGGPIKAFFKASTLNDLIEIIKTAKELNIPYLVIGGGSNLLVSDEGFEGLVIKNYIQGIKQKTRGDGERGAPLSPRSVSEEVEWGCEPAGPRVRVEVKSGTNLQDLVDYCQKKGLAGLNKLTGIPGTVGGALFGNAGAYGETISDNLIEVQCFNGEKKITLNKEECQFNYRDSIFKRNKFVILSAKFSLTPAEKTILKKDSKDLLKKRLLKYPKGIKCPGSFFKNIVAQTLSREELEKIPQEVIIFGKIPAGALLERVGAKGKSLDGIQIAPYHANLFINTGSATASDFYNLAKEYFQKVKEEFSLTLEPEVQLINLPNFNS